MMVTHTGAPPLRVAIVTILSVMVIGLVPSFAQTDPPIKCETYSAGFPIQTIVVHRVGQVCKVDPYDSDSGIPQLRSWLGRAAVWEVCNKCGAEVDVKIFDSFSLTLDQIFESMTPPIDASNNTVVTTKIPDNSQIRAFRGIVRDNEDLLGSTDYHVAVKLSAEGEGAWREFDPELQIDDYGRANDYLKWILAALLGLIFGFGGGWWFARR